MFPIAFRIPARPKHLEFYVLVGLMILFGIVILVLWLAVEGQFPGVIAGGVVGFLSGIVTLFLVYFAQVPRFKVTVKADEYHKEFQNYYVHIMVKNTSWGFLGGGAALACKGTITIDGKDYSPKWESRPEPLLETGQLVKVGDLHFRAGQPQSWLMEQAITQDLWPGEEASIDVAMKSVGDSNCYIHEAENYRDPGHKRNPLPPKRYPFTLTIKPAGRAPSAFAFILENGEGTDPASLKIVSAR